MRRAHRSIAALVLCIAASAGAAKAPDRSRDVVVKRALIPSPANVHGEARLIRRADTIVLQTLLYTQSLRRGIDAMRKKEMKAWPAGSAGYADSSRYLVMLDDAGREALKLFAARKDPSAKLQTMAIELALSPKEASFAMLMLEVDATGSEVKVVALEPFASSSASRAYVAGAMRIQSAAAFGSVPKELEEALRNER